MNIIVKITQNYGTEVIYPVCQQAFLFARIAGTKTLTLDTIVKIKALGFTVNVQQNRETL